MDNNISAGETFGMVYGHQIGEGWVLLSGNFVLAADWQCVGSMIPRIAIPICWWCCSEFDLLAWSAMR